jgi:hypothetical protein
MNSKSTAQASISKSEREDLQRLIRQREKVLKSAARQRSAELLADFENQIGSQYYFDDDAVWAEAHEIAERTVEKCNAKIAAQCAKLGIPQRFAPQLGSYWSQRGENAVKERRIELRRMAETRIEAIEAKAVTDIETWSLEAQTQIAVAGLTSDTARQFVDKLPSLETLMPRLSFAEVADEAAPPVAEQLVSPNALRQRRWRERQAALRDGNQALRDASRSGSDPPASKAAQPDPAPPTDPLDIPDYLRRAR